MNGYELSRNFWDYAFNNPEKVRPIHPSIYFFAIEHCNRLGWKKKFGLPSQMVMEAIGVKNWKTYSKGLNDLIDWGFIEMIEKSVNQYSSNIIAIVNFTKADDKALDKALLNHSQEHEPKQSQSTVSINKQLNNKQLNNETIKQSFEQFWNLYNKKVGKEKTFNKWKNLKQSEIDEILQYVPKYVRSTPDPQFRKNPLTFLNNRGWEDEIIEPKPIQQTNKNRVEHIHTSRKIEGELKVKNEIHL